MINSSNSERIFSSIFFLENIFLKPVQTHGDCEVTYAVFMRRPVTFAGRLAIDWITAMAAARQAELKIEQLYVEGAWIGAGEPICYVTGPFSVLVDLETIFLQRLGPACVAAYNAYNMCIELPDVGFLAMDARHCAGGEMAELMAYGASVGSKKAQAKTGAIGFVGCAADATAHFFGKDKGAGTMPHALIGYAGSTLRAAELFHETIPDTPLTVLVDYFGAEITDALAVATRFKDLADAGQLSVRIDTHGGRYVEGLDTPSSYAVLERNVPGALRGYRQSAHVAFLRPSQIQQHLKYPDPKDPLLFQSHQRGSSQGGRLFLRPTDGSF